MQAKLHTIIDALPNLLLLSVARTDFNLLPLSIEKSEVLIMILQLFGTIWDILYIVNWVEQ